MEGLLQEAGVVKLNESSEYFQCIRIPLLQHLGVVEPHARVLDIYVPINSTMRTAKLNSFNIYNNALTQRIGAANYISAWFSLKSLRQGLDILAHGFDHRCTTDTAGHGIVLIPTERTLFCVADTKSHGSSGIRYILYCNAIRGESELVPLGSHQCQPSSTIFDSAVDPAARWKFTFWTSTMNSYIFPMYIIALEAPSAYEMALITNSVEPLVALLPEACNYNAILTLLQNQLQPAHVSELQRHFDDFRNGTISLYELLQGAIDIVGIRSLAAMFTARS